MMFDHIHFSIYYTPLSRFITALGLGAFLLASSAHGVQNATRTLTAEEAKLDTRILKRALSELHPALTKYRSKVEIDAAFAKFEARGQAAQTSTEMYLAATELAAAIRCGHTWTNVLNQRKDVKAALQEQPNKLPFTMTLVNNRWLVLASSNAAVLAGDEVMAINGIDAATIVKMMMPYLRADGSSDTKRLRQLGHDRLDVSQMDIIWPLLSPPTNGQYSVDLRRTNGKTENVSVDSVTTGARTVKLTAQDVKQIDKTWRFRIENSVGILQLPSFSFWNSQFDWAKFLDETFTTLNDKKIPNLVIDIRDNEGGDGAIGGKIVSYLIDKPAKYTSDQSVSAYERVPYNLVRYLDTWDYSFFDRTGKVEKITSGTAIGKYNVLARSYGERTIQPVANRYKGRTFLLVGGENSSATFQFALIAQQNSAATLVGQATGGNLRGLNGGELMWVTLPNSGVSVDIPVLAVTYKADTPDTSVTPDVIVKRTLEGQRAGQDEEMAAVKRAIGQLN